MLVNFTVSNQDFWFLDLVAGEKEKVQKFSSYSCFVQLFSIHIALLLLYTVSNPYVKGLRSGPTEVHQNSPSTNRRGMTDKLGT